MITRRFPTPLRAIVLACAALAGAVPLAHADEPASSDSSASIDQVTVVGSRARNRTVFDSSAPIDRFGAQHPAARAGAGSGADAD